MLDKAQPREMMPASANAGREKRKDIGTAGPSAEITNKSKAAWIPMRLAPFYFTRNGRVCSAEKWAEDVVRVMRHYAGLPDVLPKGWELPNGMECLEAPKEWKVLIRAGGITTSVSPEWFIIHAGNRLDYTSWIISGCATDIVTGLFDAKPRAPKSYCQSEWLPSDEESLKWHAGVLGYLFSYWRQNLERALKSGAAHVMARKNSVFAPFERITWDQWQLFVVDSCAPKDKPKWHDPYWMAERRACRPMSATGPCGEKLYSIHIAPAVASVDGNSGGASKEQKLVQWLLQLMRQSPDRRPMSREQLYQEAVRIFPGTSKRAFKTCVSVALLQEPNRNWRSAGRLGKSAHK